MCIRDSSRNFLHLRNTICLQKKHQNFNSISFVLVVLLSESFHSWIALEFGFQLLGFLEITPLRKLVISCRESTEVLFVDAAVDYLWQLWRFYCFLLMIRMIHRNLSFTVIERQVNNPNKIKKRWYNFWLCWNTPGCVETLLVRVETLLVRVRVETLLLAIRSC